MAYITYTGDPNERRVNKAFANLCDTGPVKNQLKLFCRDQFPVMV